MAFAPDRVEPVFGDALAGDGGMTEPTPTSSRRDDSFDVFPDALSALPLPALTFVLPPAGAALPVARAAAASAPAGTAARAAPPTSPVWSGYPPPGQPPAVQPPTPAAASRARPSGQTRQTRPAVPTSPAGGVLAPGTGRRPVAGVGYTRPVTTASTVVRPPAYLPQNAGLTGLRAAAQQVRSGGRPPASPPSAVRPAAPTGTRRPNRASSVWGLIVFAIIFLVGSGTGHSIVEAISRLLHSR